MSDWFDSGFPHIWLPYVQMKTMPAPLKVACTEGCRIFLEDGRQLIDGVSSWWSACHGYNHPHLVSAVQKQLEIMPHVMLGGLAHAQAYRLAARLCDLAPEGLSRVFFSDSGSTAVEVALKMALQYWQHEGKPKKDRFLCFADGYHGDTFGAMSVSDPERSMHKAFRHAVIKQYVVDIPADEYAFTELDGLLSGVSKELAGMIIEPLVQGAGGFRFHGPDVLAALRELAHKHEMLFIADEVATGFGRTGTMFACDEAGISPDILCLGKGLTGGMLGLGATLSSETLFNAFYSDDPEAALMHGPTFMGNALACAAANASLDLFEAEPRMAQVDAIERQLNAELAVCEGLPGVKDVRVKGAIGVVQMNAPIRDANGLRTRFIDKGCWIRPFGDVVYLAPPFVISEAELCTLTSAVVEVLSSDDGR